MKKMLAVLALIVSVLFFAPPANAWYGYNENSGYTNFWMPGPPPGPSLSLCHVNALINDDNTSPDYARIVGENWGGSACVAVCVQAVISGGNGHYDCAQLGQGDYVAESSIAGNPDIIGARFQAYNAFGYACQWDINLTSGGQYCWNY